jgi:hypothetical protein
MLRDLNYAVMVALIGKQDFQFLRNGYITADLPDEETYTLVCTFPDLEDKDYEQIVDYFKKTRKNYAVRLIPNTKSDTIEPCDTPSTNPTTQPPATLAIS